MSVYINDDIRLFYLSLLSVFSNSLTPDQFVLVVDGPISDDLKSIISLYKRDFIIDVLPLTKNTGLANALNEGLKIAKNSWIVRSDADDINVSERFSILSNYMNAQYDVFGSFILEREYHAGLFSNLNVKKVPTHHSEIYNFSKVRNPFNHMSVCFRKDLIIGVGGYPNLYLKEDYALWVLLILNKAKMYNVNEVLVFATGGRRLIARRGGFKYVFSEFQLQLYFYKIGFKNLPSSILHFLIRSFVFISPSFIRQYFYLKFLRK